MLVHTSGNYRSPAFEQSRPAAPNSKDYRKLPGKLLIQSSQEGNICAGRKICQSGLNDQASGRRQVQELVDQLHSCSEEDKLAEVTAIHGRVLRYDFSEEDLLVLLNHVMHAYMKCLDLRKAKAVFDSLSKKNEFSWSVMITGLNENGLFLDGLNYFANMMDQGIFLDKFACVAVLQLCIGLNYVELGCMIHAQIIARGLMDHVVVCTALLNMYAKLGEIKKADKVFNSMPEHNDVSWNAMISGLSANSLYVEAFNSFLMMKNQGFGANISTLLSVAKAVGMLGDVDKGNHVYECALELGVLDNVHVGTSLIEMYSKCGALLQARSFFDFHFGSCEVSAPWNAIISGYTAGKCSQQALKLFVKMCESNIKSDIYTFCIVFDAISDLKSSWFVAEVHGMLLKYWHSLMDLSVENAMMDAYSKCGCLEDVEKIFNRMAHRDLVSWTTLLTAYSQSREWEEAIAVFSLMREEGFVPNQFTLSSLLIACSNLSDLEYGRQIHGLLHKLGLVTDSCVESALIDMYAKGGSIMDAETVFNLISSPDVFSMTAIISGYAHHGFINHALRHFGRMERMGIKPNAISMLCVLFACSHAGLVDQGLDYFWSMERDYGLVPKMEHYACVVDLLGRVGRLDEAFEFIMKMPIQPDEMVWQTLLASCRIHGNVKFGKVAAEKILSLCPEYSSTYVLLSNTYMEAGSFSDGVHLRNMMKEHGIRKEPGYSWINVRGKVHRFYAGDKEHPQKDDIYLYLEELRRTMATLDYVPDLRFALQCEN